MTDPTVLAALAAIHQDELNKCVNFENSFAYLVPVCPVAAKAAKKTKVSFNANVSAAAGGKKSPGGGGLEVGTHLQVKVKVAYLYAITPTRNSWTLTRTRETSCLNGLRLMGARRKVEANKEVILHVDLPKLVTQTSNSSP